MSQPGSQWGPAQPRPNGSWVAPDPSPQAQGAPVPHQYTPPGYTPAGRPLQPAFPAQPGPQPALVHIEAHQFGSMGLALTPAKVVVDGVEQSLNIGGNDLLLTPGPHHLETYAVWTFGPFGRAGYDTVLQPGQRLDLHWNVPSVAWIKQSTLGPEQGPAPGKGCLIAVYVFLGLVLLAAIMGMFVGLFTL